MRRHKGTAAALLDERNLLGCRLGMLPVAVAVADLDTVRCERKRPSCRSLAEAENREPIGMLVETDSRHFAAEASTQMVAGYTGLATDRRNDHPGRHNDRHTILLCF